MKHQIQPYSPASNVALALKFAQAEQKNNTIDDFLKNFLGQFISRNTKKEYLKDMNLFFEFLRSGGVILTHPKQIQSYHFQIYRDGMIEKGHASATINRRLVAIRSFIKWAIGAGMVEFNPLDAVKLPKVRTESETIAFEDAEAVAMIGKPDVSTHRGRTHRLILVLLFNLGLRRSELINIRVQDFFQDRGHSVLRIRGKGEKTRLIPLSDFVGDEIKKYIDSLADSAAQVELNKDDFLLQRSDQGRKNSKAMDGSTIYRIVTNYALDLGIIKRVSPHSCRATVISHLLDTQKTPIRDVAGFAGHSNITTTERYDKRRNNLNSSAAYSVDLRD